MRIFFRICFLLPVIGCWLAGCDNAQDTLAVSRTPDTVSGKGAIVQLTVYCSGTWTSRVVHGNGWIQLIPESGSGNTPVTVAIDPNRTSGALRRGAVLFSCGTQEQHVVIAQRDFDTPDN